MLTFRQYIQYKNPIGSCRSKLFVIRFRLSGNDTIESLTTKSGIGKKSAKDIIQLQQKYHSKSYSK